MTFGKSKKNVQRNKEYGRPIEMAHLFSFLFLCPESSSSSSLPQRNIFFSVFNGASQHAAPPCLDNWLATWKLTHTRISLIYLSKHRLYCVGFSSPPSILHSSSSSSILFLHLFFLHIIRSSASTLLYWRASNAYPLFERVFGLFTNTTIAGYGKIVIRHWRLLYLLDPVIIR